MESEDSGTRASTQTITEDQGWSTQDSDSLLKSRDTIDIHNGNGFRFLQRRISAKFHLAIFSFYIVTLVGVGILLSRSWSSGSKPYLYCELSALYSGTDIINAIVITAPANDAVEYYIGEFTDGNDPHGKFVGNPRPSLEKAWQDLLGRK